MIGKTFITINERTYPIKFGMGALIHFSEGLGYDVEKTIEELTTPGVNQIKGIAKFIYAALYVDAVYKEQPLDVDFSDVIEWVDTNPTGEVTKVVEAIMKGLASITQVNYPEGKKEEAKKK